LSCFTPRPKQDDFVFVLQPALMTVGLPVRAAAYFSYCDRRVTIPLSDQRETIAASQQSIGAVA
jgi:hypothetical protein